MKIKLFIKILIDQMKKLYFVLIVFTIFSCGKEECKNYVLVLESNQKEAEYKCQGLANNYPKLEIISSQDAGCLTEYEVKSVKLKEKFETKQLCNGVTATINFSLRLK